MCQSPHPRVQAGPIHRLSLAFRGLRSHGRRPASPPPAAPPVVGPVSPPAARDAADGCARGELCPRQGQLDKIARDVNTRACAAGPSSAADARMSRLQSGMCPRPIVDATGGASDDHLSPPPHARCPARGRICPIAREPMPVASRVGFSPSVHAHGNLSRSHDVRNGRAKRQGDKRHATAKAG